METVRPHHDRFKDAPWYPKERINILVGGAGGIGSWTSLLLSRAGFSPLIYDFDSLELHNLGGQLYSKKMVGELKVDAIANIIKDFSDEEILTFNEKVDNNTPTHSYVVAAFDNMLARKQMFTSWYEHMAENPDLRDKGIFIDGRLNAEQMWIYCIKGSDAEMCEKYISDCLFDDSEIEEAPCTFKQTSHAAAMIAAHITGFFTNHIVNVLEGDNSRAVPFSWEYFIPMDLLNVQNI